MFIFYPSNLWKATRATFKSDLKSHCEFQQSARSRTRLCGLNFYASFLFYWKFVSLLLIAKRNVNWSAVFLNRAEQNVLRNSVAIHREWIMHALTSALGWDYVSIMEADQKLLLSLSSRAGEQTITADFPLAFSSRKLFCFSKKRKALSMLKLSFVLNFTSRASSFSPPPMGFIEI